MPVATHARLACAQVESAWLDLKAGVEKTKQLIKDAKKQGADILVLPELWLPGYPWYMWVLPYAATVPYTLRYQSAAMAADGPEMKELQQAAREAHLVVSFGFAEKRGESMWMANAIIDATGEIASIKRKWKPTGVERVMFGDASGDVFNTVASTSLGQVGALMCWEHLINPLKMHCYQQHETVHAGSWPPIFPHGGMEHYGMSYQGIRAISSTYAMEGGSFVAMSTGLVSEAGARKIGLDYAVSGEPLPEGAFHTIPGGGYATIFGPDGRQLSTDLPPSQEGFVWADIDPVLIKLAKQLVCPAGHYARPDLAQLVINREVRDVVTAGETAKEEEKASTSINSKVLPSKALNGASKPDGELALA